MKYSKGNMIKTTLTGESEVLLYAKYSSCAVGSASRWPSSESRSSPELRGGVSESGGKKVVKLYQYGVRNIGIQI